MFRQNNAILREQLDSFLSYFNVNMVGSKSRDDWYRSMCQRVMQEFYCPIVIFCENITFSEI
jgi:hypothetical protein